MSRTRNCPSFVRIALTLTVVLLGGIAAVAASHPATASAATAAVAENTTAPRVAIVRSAIAEGAPLGHHYLRVDKVVTWLRTEFGDGNVSVIGDAQLASVSALKNYDVVLLVRQLAMSKAQRLAVRSYAAGGGGVVAVFGAGRWDYRAGTSPHYVQTMKAYGSGSHEWGEVSEVWGVSFYNDPITAAQQHIVGEYGSRHPILQMTYAELGRTTRLDMAPAREDANEYVTIKSGGSATVIAHYTNAPTTGLPRNGAGWAAAWANQYKFGRAVYFGCQIADAAGVMKQASQDTRAQARSLLMNSVRWAGQSIMIGASAAGATRQTSVVLSGVVRPVGGTDGKMVRLEVMKPGSSRWSDSSSSAVSVDGNGIASWRSEYAFNSGSPLGAYAFRAVYVGGSGEVPRVSGSVKVTVK